MKKGKALLSQPTWSPVCSFCGRIRLRSIRQLSKTESTSCSSMVRIASNTSRTTQRKGGEFFAQAARSPGMTAHRGTAKSFDFLNRLSIASRELPEPLWHFVSNLESCRVNPPEPRGHFYPSKRFLRFRLRGGCLRKAL